MPYNENPNSENLYKKEIEIIEEELRQRRKSWFRNHMTAIYIIAGAVIAALIFLGIKWYNDSHNPISRLVSASGKNLGSSFTFQLTADKDGEPMMSYDGAVKINSSAQTVAIAYNAAYSDYTYTNVIYTNGALTYRGNCYNKQWSVIDCTDRVQEYFDFYNDYKNGSFDGGSFLRLTGLNSTLYAVELNKFVDTVKSRLSTDSAIAKITTTHDGGSVTYSYDISLKALFDLVRDQGAPIFYTSPDYNRFIARLDANEENIERASCTFDFTVSPSGYLSALNVRIDTGESAYSIRLTMDDFGSAEPEIPDAFYEAANLQKPE